jgi:hypothetical protein
VPAFPPAFPLTPPAFDEGAPPDAETAEAEPELAAEQAATHGTNQPSDKTPRLRARKKQIMAFAAQ